MRVTVLGLGRMGKAVATRLLETGHEVTVWNRTPGREGDMAERGARISRSLAEALAGTEVAITLLTADQAVREVVLAEGGVAARLGEGTTLVDMSTVSPDTSRAVAQGLPAGHFIDSPVLGGPDVTEKGQARLLLGGDRRAVDSLEPLWKDISSGYVYCGPNGSATTMKLLSNLNLVGGTMLLAEAVAAGRGAGIEDDVLRQVLGTSPAVAPGVRVRLEAIVSGKHEGWWSIQLAQKDVGLALKVGREGGLTLPLGTAAQQVLERTEKAGYGEKDLSAVVEAIDRPAAVKR